MKEEIVIILLGIFVLSAYAITGAEDFANQTRYVDFRSEMSEVSK